MPFKPYNSPNRKPSAIEPKAYIPKSKRNRTTPMYYQKKGQRKYECVACGKTAMLYPGEAHQYRRDMGVKTTPRQRPCEHCSSVLWKPVSTKAKKTAKDIAKKPITVSEILRGRNTQNLSSPRRKTAQKAPKTLANTPDPLNPPPRSS